MGMNAFSYDNFIGRERLSLSPTNTRVEEEMFNWMMRSDLQLPSTAWIWRLAMWIFTTIYDDPGTM